MGQSNTSKGAVVVVVAVVAMLIVASLSVTILVNKYSPTPTVSTMVPTPTAHTTDIAQGPVVTTTASLATTVATTTHAATTAVPQSPTSVATTQIPATGTNTATGTATSTLTGTAAPTLTPTIPASPTATQTPFPIPPIQATGDSSLYIPKLGWKKAIEIITLPIVGTTWDVTNLGHSIGHLDQTSWVGDQGNVVLVAHIQLAVDDYGPFLYLKKLEVGDAVYLVDHGTVYAYQITEKTTVDPTQVEVTNPTVNPTITLITCTVWDSSRGLFAKRLVVKGTRVRVATLAHT
jgi:LPXTG-site transpeptidase (sortase) family protein